MILSAQRPLYQAVAVTEGDWGREITSFTDRLR